MKIVKTVILSLECCQLFIYVSMVTLNDIYDVQFLV